MKNQTVSSGTVLIIEDDAIDLRCLIRILNSFDDTLSYNTAGTYTEASGLLRNNRYDVIISDLNLPDSDGIDTVTKVLSCSGNSPVIILSGNENEELALSAVNAGAEDYICKDYLSDKNIIVRSIRHAIERNRLKLDIQSMRDRERKLAHYDQVTGLPNRLLFADRLTQAVEHTERTDQGFAVCFIDLDRFKSINDSFGHKVGDEVLRQTGQRLTKTLRKVDTVARIGGDEFTLILSNISNHKNIITTVEKCIDAICEPIIVGSIECSVGASVGIACYPKDAQTSEQLLTNADMAMYQAKNETTYCYRFFSTELLEEALAALDTERELKDALSNHNDQITLHYQPKINLESHSIGSVEALIRWNHPERGLVAPDAFIPIAEEVGLILNIDQLVLRSACQQLSRWKHELRDDIRIAVNISGRSFEQDSFVEGVLIPTINEYEVSAKNLEIEITEGVLIHDLDAARRRLERIADLGVHITIDDFGTGFCSLKYLSKLPLNTLKIDGSFICSASSESKKKAILKAIIELGRALEVNIVAERIETREQLDFVKNLGCNEGQGFYFGQPLSQWQPVNVSNH